MAHPRYAIPSASNVAHTAMPPTNPRTASSLNQHLQSSDRRAEVGKSVRGRTDQSGSSWAETGQVSLFGLDLDRITTRSRDNVAMFNRRVVEKLIAATDAPPVRVNAAACLNAKHKGRHCDACLACPTDAIHLRGALVELDAARCTECGVCLATCPTGVFAANDSDDAAILRAAESFAHVELACQRRQPHDATRAPQVGGVVTLKCLARLSPELLTALAAEHPTVWLDDSPCADCPIGARTHPRVRVACEAANCLLAAWNRPPIKCYTGSADQLATQARRVSGLTEKDQRASRRELFAFLSRRATQSAATVIAEMISGSPAPSVEGMDASERSRPRQTLLRALTSLGGMQAEYVASDRFASIRIAESCTACGLCARICPTRALQFHAADNSFVLVLDTRNCLATACRLCELICSPHAIALTMGATRESLATNYQTLRSGALSVCRQCSTPFAAAAGQSLCSICRDAETKRKALVDDLFKKF
jgi:energy-converting hydrogenase B subunit K